MLLHQLRVLGAQDAPQAANQLPVVVGTRMCLVALRKNIMCLGAISMHTTIQHHPNTHVDGGQCGR